MEVKCNEFLTESHFILVGNKIDVSSSRVIPESEGRDYANSQSLQFAEVSARTSAGVHELFDSIA
jgi:GTPase SAR1 family protein